MTWYASWSQFDPGKTITPNFTLLSPRGSLRLWDWKGLRAPFSRLTQGRARCPANRPAKSRSISPAARRKFPRSRVALPSAGWLFPADLALRILGSHKLWLSFIYLRCYLPRQFSLCNLCVLCVSVVCIAAKSPQRHREHRGCTEKSLLKKQLLA